MVSMKSVTVPEAEKRRQVMVDLAIGLGLPVMEMVLRTSRCYFPFPFLLTSHQNIFLKATDSISLKRLVAIPLPTTHP